MESFFAARNCRYILYSAQSCSSLGLVIVPGDPRVMRECFRAWKASMSV